MLRPFEARMHKLDPYLPDLAKIVRGRAARPVIGHGDNKSGGRRGTITVGALAGTASRPLHMM